MKRNRLLFVIAIVAILAVLFVACDDKAQGTEPTHTHTYGAWSLTTEPTETTDGSATRVCACGESETTTVAKLSDASVWTVTVSQDATHETAGFKAYKSDVYGTVTVTSPKGQHVYGGWEISVEPTETETGIARRFCACGHSESVTLAVLGNTSVWTKTTEGATHTAPGKEIYTSEYGVVTVLTSAEQHVYGEWTSNGDGTHSRVCVCGDRQTENCAYNQKVAAPAFLKSAASCTTKAEYYMSCVCGAHSTEATFESGTALGHDYYNFQVVSEPTCTEDGQVVADCRNCDQKYDGAIPALGHDFTGACVPYVEDVSYGEEYEGGSYYDGSVFHVHKCTRCDAVDSAHKEKHAFGEAVYSLSLVQGTTNMYNVNATYTCSGCGYKKFNTDEFNRYIGQDDAWTKGEEVKADYNQPGYVEYTFKDTGKTIRIATPQLVAPYVGTTYYAFNVNTTENGGAVSLNDYSSIRITFDENGKGSCESAPCRGDNTIRIVDAKTGAITYTVVDGDSTHNETGAINLDNGVIVRSYMGSIDRLVVMIPTSMTVTVNDVTGSTWTDSMAFAYNAKCNLNETHTFNAFVYDGKVYFGAQFVDADGKAVAAGACSEASYVKVLDAQGNKVQAFAQKNGGLRVTDGKEGTYTSVDNTLKFDGVGGFVLNGKSGFYTVAAEGASYGYDAYVGADVATATEYYQITLGENNTCTVVKPEATLRFRGDGVVDVANITANVNIVTSLPTPEREGYVFNGWQLNGEGDAVSTFVATEAGVEYLFEAQWTKKTTVTVRDLKDEDKAQYSTVYVGVGNPFVGVLPAYNENTYRDGYKFAGWYLDNGNGVLNIKEDTPLDDADTAQNEGADYVIFAAWNWQGNVTFAEQTGYTFVYDAAKGYWASNNKGKDNTSATMEIIVESGVAVISFDYLVSSAESDKLTIWYGPDWKSIVVSGKNNEWQTLTTTIDFNKVEYDSSKRVRITYAKDSSSFDGDDTAYIRNFTINGVAMTAQSSLNKNAGTYTSEGAEDIKVSAGGTVTIGENTYLTSNVSENVLGVMVGDVYKEYTLDTAAKTYTVVEPKVTVAYNYNVHGTNTSAQVGKYSEQTLSTEVPTADGFIFRGWYTDEALTKEASKTFVASADVTFYAKWDEAITLTYNYLNGGANADVVVNLYANDTVETLQAVDFDWEGKKFVGWFTKDGSADGDWGDEFVADTTLIKSTTVYAKWVAPHALMGNYAYGANLDPSESGIVSETDTLTKNSSSYSLTIDADGNVTGGVKGVVKDYDPATGTFYVLSNNSKYYGGYNAETKTIYVDYRANMTDAYHDIKFAAAQIDDEVPSATFNNAWDNGKTKLVRITYKNSESVESYRYILIYGKSIYSVTSWSATDASGAAVTDFTKIYSNANLLTVVYGDKTLAVGRKSNNFSALDGYQGTYSNGLADIVLDGVGGITYGTETGTYTVAAEDAGYTFDVKTANKSYKLTVNKDDKTTYTIVENTVTISFVNDKVTVDNITAYVGFRVTLPTPAEVEGFVFRGWYDNAEFSGSAVTSLTATENATYYAKYDEAVTVTFDYSGYEYETGKSTLEVTGKYVNDTLGNVIPTVASDVIHDGKVFAGWFFKDGEAWGEQVSSSTKLTESVTIFARWIEPAASAGIYKGFEVYSVKSGSEKANSDFSTVLTINADGSFSGTRITAGKLSADDAAKTNGAINITRYAYLSDALGGIVIFGYYNDATSVGTDFYIGFANANVTKVEYSADTIGGGYVAFFTVSYTEDGTAKTMNLFVYNNEIIANVTFTDGVTAKAAASTTEVLVKDATGNPIVKKSGSALLGNDGKSGSYNGTELGEVVLNGFGALTAKGQNVAYTLNADKTQATFVLNNQMRVIALGNGTYTLALDGYQGTYTLPDESTLELDGHGVVTGTSKTYVVDNGTLTIYEGEMSTTYGIDEDNKTLNDKSQFAGMVFTGSYYDGWDEQTDSISLTFDDASALTGVFKHNGGSYSSAVEAKFTATFDGTTMVLTFSTGWAGKTVELTYSDGAFVVKKFCYSGPQQYAVKVGTKLTQKA